MTRYKKSFFDVMQELASLSPRPQDAAGAFRVRAMLGGWTKSDIDQALAGPFFPAFNPIRSPADRRYNVAAVRVHARIEELLRLVNLHGEASAEFCPLENIGDLLRIDIDLGRLTAQIRSVLGV